MTRNDGARLQQARHNAGLSLDDVLFAVRTGLPQPMWISRAKIARWEKTAHVDDPFMVAFLADLYEVDLQEEFPETCEALAAISDMLFRCRHH